MGLIASLALLATSLGLTYTLATLLRNQPARPRWLTRWITFVLSATVATSIYLGLGLLMKLI